MTKKSHVILYFIIFLYPAIFFANKISADYLIRPIPEESLTKNLELRTMNYEPIFNNPQPTTHMSFGQILGITPSPTQNNVGGQPSQLPSDGQNSALIETVRNLLAKYQEEAAVRLEEFNNQPRTKNLELRTKIEKVSDLVTTPVPTLHPNLEKILADARDSKLRTKNLELKTENREENYQLPIINYQLLGSIDVNPKKTHYTIALLGDSMVDTLGKDLPHLQKLLGEAYPDYTFNLLNYGQGGTDLDSGLYRLTNTTNYLGADYSPLLSHKPDILVIESFAYNHWSGQYFDLDRQWLTIAKIIDSIKANSPDTNIILAATIAPNTNTFGDGKLNWPKQLKWDSATITKGYLQNLVNFATSEHYPLADAYHPSMDGNGNGKEIYINQGDHIHPSGTGALLFSQKIVETIKENKLIN